MRDSRWRTPGLVPSRVFLRQQRTPRRDHQDRQCAGAARADRGSLDSSHAARVSRKLHDRNVEISTAIRDIAWKGQIWVCSPYRQLAAAGNPKVVVTIAIAREQLYLGYCSDCAAQIPKPTQSAYSNARRSTTRDRWVRTAGDRTTVGNSAGPGPRTDAPHLERGSSKTETTIMR